MISTGLGSITEFLADVRSFFSLLRSVIESPLPWSVFSLDEARSLDFLSWRRRKVAYVDGFVSSAPEVVWRVKPLLEDEAPRVV